MIIDRHVPLKIFVPKTEPDCYGASSLVSKKLKLPLRPRSFCYWNHGWNHVPLKFTQQLGYDYDGKYLVSTEEEANFLKSAGKLSKAVGAPFIYTDWFLDQIDTNKMSNSLLIMPAHGMTYTSEAYAEDDYIQELRDIIPDFEHVVVCISPNDIIKGRWINSFRKLNIPIISGAQMNDQNALIRMRAMFEKFEYMTTNSIGSHIAYAAFCNVRTSIFGSYQFMDIQNYAKDDLYKRYPEILDYVHHHQCEQSVRARFPKLFSSHPLNANYLQKEANSWLGVGNKKSAIEIARDLSWFPDQQIGHYCRKVLRKLNKIISQRA